MNLWVRVNHESPTNNTDYALHCRYLHSCSLNDKFSKSLFLQNGEDLELDSVTSEISSHEDETIGSSRENVAMGIPTIVTYPPNRELSAVTEESITSSLGVRTPHHHRLEETVIEDPINEQKVKAAEKKNC